MSSHRTQLEAHTGAIVRVYDDDSTGALTVTLAQSTIICIPWILSGYTTRVTSDNSPS
jgi:hypothetical protein